MPKNLAPSYTGYTRSFRLGILIGLLALPIGNAALAEQGGAGKGEAGGDRALRLKTLAPVPASKTNNTAGAMYSFDISFVDQKTETYYLADRSNAAVDVVDAKTGTFTKQIAAVPAFKGFSGSNATSGPNGVVSAYPWLFVTDANSRVVTIDVRNDKTVSDVSTGGAAGLRADELAYDPEHGTLLVINNADAPPFGTLISVDKATGKLTVGKRITFDAAHGVDAQNGAEQPVWNPETNRFYLSIPQVGPTVSNGGVIRIDPFSATVEATYSVKFCGPAGLALGPHQDLFIGCNMVFDTAGNVWDPNGTVAAVRRRGRRRGVVQLGRRQLLRDRQRQPGTPTARRHRQGLDTGRGSGRKRSEASAAVPDLQRSGRDDGPRVRSAPGGHLALDRRQFAEQSGLRSAAGEQRGPESGWQE